MSTSGRAIPWDNVKSCCPLWFSGRMVAPMLTICAWAAQNRRRKQVRAVISCQNCLVLREKRHCAEQKVATIKAGTVIEFLLQITNLKLSSEPDTISSTTAAQQGKYWKIVLRSFLKCCQNVLHAATLWLEKHCAWDTLVSDCSIKHFANCNQISFWNS